MYDRTGLSLIEALAVLVAFGIVVTLAAPALGNLRSSARMRAGASEMVMTFRALRWKSVARARSHGLLFRRDAQGWRWLHVQDGNGNGLSSSEVGDGTDPVVSGPHRLEEQVPHVTLGFPGPGPYPKVPPKNGTFEGTDDPIRIGNTELLSFGPLGTSTSGTLYLTDGQALYAIVLFGKTGRITTWRFDAGSRKWKR